METKGPSFSGLQTCLLPESPISENFYYIEAELWLLGEPKLSGCDSIAIHELRIVKKAFGDSSRFSACFQRNLRAIRAVVSRTVLLSY